MNYVRLYTDGSCDPNPGQGGWGVLVLIFKENKLMKSLKLQGYSANTTNNRMELLACIKALEYVEFVEKPRSITILSDSQYVVSCIQERWYEKWISKNWHGVKNPDLWKDFLDRLGRYLRIQFIKVKGHSENKFNDLADTFANEASILKIEKCEPFKIKY